MTRYVAGFLFDTNHERVVLITKNRPQWQKGKINGVGGHIEEGEQPHDAMVREFREETSLSIGMWTNFAHMTVSDVAEVWFFRSFGYIDAAQSMTDEEIGIYKVNALPENTMRNLRWLIPMALDIDLKTPVEIHDMSGYKA